MRSLITTLFFVSLYLNAYSQPYQIVKEITTNDSIKSGDNISEIYFKIYKDTVYQIRPIQKDNRHFDLKLTLFNLETGAIIKCDTLSGIPLGFTVRDFVVNNGRMLITSTDKIIYFDINNIGNSLFLYPDNLIEKNDPQSFRFCENLNDSLILLYITYNYHPADGNAGAQMKIFNMHTKQFTHYIFSKFPGIAITHISGNWITVANGAIYMVTPLSGEVQMFDFGLNKLGSYAIKVFDDSELNKNKLFEARIDAAIDSESTRIHGIINKYPKDSLKYHRSEFASLTYGKDFISNTIHEVKEKHSYICNISSQRDSLITLSVSRPEYSNKYRDIYFFDPNKKEIVKAYIKFKCVHSDTLAQPKDFFNINFTYGKPLIPFVDRNIIYYPSLYPLSAFETGTYNDVSLKLFNETKNTGYKWNLIKYQLE